MSAPSIASVVPVTEALASGSAVGVEMVSVVEVDSDSYCGTPAGVASGDCGAVGVAVAVASGSELTTTIGSSSAPPPHPAATSRAIATPMVAIIWIVRLAFIGNPRSRESLRLG